MRAFHGPTWKRSASLFFPAPSEREHVETGCFFSERPFRQFTTVRSWLNVLEKKMSTIRRILKWKVSPNATISDQSADYILLFATQWLSFRLISVCDTETGQLNLILDMEESQGLRKFGIYSALVNLMLLDQLILTTLVTHCFNRQKWIKRRGRPSCLSTGVWMTRSACRSPAPRGPSSGWKASSCNWRHRSIATTKISRPSSSRYNH